MLESEVRISVDVAMPAPPGLRYVCDAGPAITRRRAGKGFVYLDAKGRRVGNADTLERIRSLVVPPAWTNVWICAGADGHIQATGRDAKGRKQYKYHAEYREAREQSKYEHLFEFAAALPTIRAKVAEHMSLRGLPREKVLATVVHLLETTLIRVGNDEYARNNQSYGLTTLRSDHVAVKGSEVRFQFTGKSGKQWSLAMRDRRVARIIRACQELPGQDLLQYFDEDKELRAVSSGDVNAYLREIARGDITAKDFRTWAGTMLMARLLSTSDPFTSQTRAKRVMSAAVKKVAAALGNTAAVCRKSYIHPAIANAYLGGGFVLEATQEAGTPTSVGLTAEETAVLALLKPSPSPRERGGASSLLPSGEGGAKRWMRERRQPSPPTLLPAGEGSRAFTARRRVIGCLSEGKTSHGELRPEDNLPYPSRAAFAPAPRAGPAHEGARKPARREASD
ncbi:MAG TPA: DNA topoisomerase IB [Roseiarcus sp.]